MRFRPGRRCPIAPRRPTTVALVRARYWPVVNLLDLVLVALAAVVVVHGTRVGFVRMALGGVGVVAGLAVGFACLPPILRASGLAPTTRVVLALAAFVVVPSVVAGAFEWAGAHLSHAVRALRLASLDRTLGAVLGAEVAGVVVWILAGLLVTVASPTLVRAARGSVVLRSVDAHFPRAPATLSRLQHDLAGRGMPLPFAGFEPDPPARALPSPAAVAQAAAGARAATVKVHGPGCGGEVVGSGISLGDGIVATNAHVVADVRAVAVDDAAGTHRATPVVFDPRVDLALLAVDGLDAPALVLAPQAVSAGATGAVVGYPGGGPLDVEPAVVLDRRDALGRDIWGGDLVTREIYVLGARVRPGNSGGPLVGADGSVLGVVFARSSVRDEVGYALTDAELRKAIARPRSATGVATGGCAAA